MKIVTLIRNKSLNKKNQTVAATMAPLRHYRHHINTDQRLSEITLQLTNRNVYSQKI